MTSNNNSNKTIKYHVMSKTMEVNLECGGSIQKVLGNFLCVRE